MTVVLTAVIGSRVRQTHFGGVVSVLIDQAFGFLASKEVKDAGVGNIGLEDRE